MAKKSFCIVDYAISQNIIFEKEIKPVSTANWFNGMTNVTNMFDGCEKLININANGCSAKTVTDIAYALYDRTGLDESGLLIMDIPYEDFNKIYEYVKSINWNIPLDNYIDYMTYSISTTYCAKKRVAPRFNRRVGK